MSTDWTAILKTVTQSVNLLSPIVESLVPGAAIAIDIAQRIAQGVIAAEPAAMALYNRLTTGADVTPEELQAYINDNEASYAELQAAIAVKLANLPSTA